MKVRISSELGYITKNETDLLIKEIVKMGNLLGGFKKYLNK